MRNNNAYTHQGLRKVCKQKGTGKGLLEGGRKGRGGKKEESQKKNIINKKEDCNCVSI